MSVKLLNEHHLEFLSLKRGCTALSESTLVKMPHCWKSHVMAQLLSHLMAKAAVHNAVIVYLLLLFFLLCVCVFLFHCVFLGSILV